ncbi:MAG TPA: cupin domain-containing protein [Gaiellaceae bacterium]|jgi:uncharacterized cupin superfamily protein|nr:cupin domain-containing protein [Gaiellaceae bacterium]
MPEEARLEQVGRGLAPVGEGWFVVNARDAAWLRHEAFGERCVFECNGAVARAREDVEVQLFPQLGITLAVFQPGQPSTLYHAEPRQEDFLVLSGSCAAVIDGERRELRAWDFVHCPAGTPHSFVGAGDGPCVMVAVGARTGERGVRYFPTPLAASVDEETDSPAEAYAPYGHWVNDGVSPLS